MGGALQDRWVGGVGGVGGWCEWHIDSKIKSVPRGYEDFGCRLVLGANMCIVHCTVYIRICIQQLRSTGSRGGAVGVRGRDANILSVNVEYIFER